MSLTAKKATTKTASKRKVRLNTLLTKLNLRNLEEIRDFLIGKRVKIMSYGGGHNYLLGKTYQIDESCTISQFNISGMMLETGYGGNMIDFYNLELVDTNSEGVKQMIKEYNKQISVLDKEKEALKLQLEYLEETKTDEFDERAYRIYTFKKLLNSSLSTDEKATEIEKLFF